MLYIYFSRLVCAWDIFPLIRLRTVPTAERRGILHRVAFRSYSYGWCSCNITVCPFTARAPSGTDWLLTLPTPSICTFSP